MTAVEMTFSSPNQAIQYLADEVGKLSSRTHELEMQVTAQGVVLQFLKHVSIRSGVEAPDVWNKMIGEFAASMESRNGSDKLQAANKMVADAAREFVIDPEDPTPPGLRVIDGGKEG